MHTSNKCDRNGATNYGYDYDNLQQRTVNMEHEQTPVHAKHLVSPVSCNYADSTQFSNTVVPVVVGSQSLGAEGLFPDPPKKTVLEAYILAFPLGLLGAHHYYLRRYAWGVVYTFTFAMFGIGWIADLVRMPWLVKVANKRIKYPEQFQKKTLVEAYMCWLPLGLFGGHHFYLHRWIWGALYLCTFGLFGFGWLLDAFIMCRHVKTANQVLKAEHDNRALSNTKKLSEAYLLGASPLGFFGAHHFYLDRSGFGVVYLFTFGLFGLGWFVDLFRMKFLVDRANQKFKNAYNELKHLDDAYVLHFPLGLFGLHHFYLDRPCWGFLYLCTCGCFGIGWIIDFFRMPCLVSDANKAIMNRQGVIISAGNIIIDTSTGRIVTTITSPVQYGSTMNTNNYSASGTANQRVSDRNSDFHNEFYNPPSYDEVIRSSLQQPSSVTSSINSDPYFSNVTESTISFEDNVTEKK